MTAHTPGPWVIDNRSIYEGQHGLGMKPTQLGAVIAECPTAFGTHTVRAPSTIGKPCPTKAELDALGLAHAHLVKAAPELLAELEKARQLVRLVTVRQVIRAGDKAIEAAGLNPYCIAEGLATGEEPLDIWSIDAVIARAKGGE